MLAIARTAYDGMVEHARRDVPIEACGYLAGRDDVALFHYELTNQDLSATHFSLAPEQQFEAIRSMTASRLSPMAVYHSHPATPARPSEEDIRLAADPRMTYVIISLSRNTPETAAFRVVDKQVRAEETEVMENVQRTAAHCVNLDISKDVCPITFVKVKVALAELQKGDRLAVLMTGGEPLRNVPRSTEEHGHEVLDITEEGPLYRVLIEK